MQATCHSLSSGLRLMLAGEMQGSFLDNSTSCFELILEPSAIEIVLQLGAAPATASMSQDGLEDQTLEIGSGHLPHNDPLALGSAPAQPGLTLLLRCALALQTTTERIALPADLLLMSRVCNGCC